MHFSPNDQAYFMSRFSVNVSRNECLHIEQSSHNLKKQSVNGNGNSLNTDWGLADD